MEKNPNIAVKGSIKINVEQNKEYFWCSCGKSQSQPFCDGSHSGTEFKPILYKAEETKLVSFCGCKYSNKAPICDGAHKQL